MTSNGRRSGLARAPSSLEIELGYLVRRDAPIAALADVDRPGVRVGVAAKSSSDSALTRDLKQATVVRATTLDAARPSSGPACAAPSSQHRPACLAVPGSEEAP